MVNPRKGLISCYVIRSEQKVSSNVWRRIIAQLPINSSHSRLVFAARERYNKTIHLRFLLNPIEFQHDPLRPNSLGSIVYERTKLVGEPGSQCAVGTGLFQTIDAKMALFSIGYQGIPINGTEQYFDTERGVFRHEHGLVDAANNSNGGLYATG